MGTRKKIIGLAGSNSSASINGKLVNYAGTQLTDHEFEFLDLRLADIPVYGIDQEKEGRFPEAIQHLLKRVGESDGLVLSVAEHNGNMTAYLKNILDWLSRLDRKWLLNTKVLLMSSSPGRGAAKTAFSLVEKSLPFSGGEIAATFHFPSFGQNSTESPVFTITNDSLASECKEAIRLFAASLEQPVLQGE